MDFSWREKKYQIILKVRNLPVNEEKEENYVRCNKS